jgi:16S rRNA (adenine1518-N6/adenine1519-N6)-dimethyltransferase
VDQNTRAKKGLGQNFLVDDGVVDRIVASVEPLHGVAVVEIGPGRGALTRRLLENATAVFGVEIDRDLVPFLREEFRNEENFKVIEADALSVDLCHVIAPWKQAVAIGNLPYYISTPILQRLIAQRSCLSELVLMLQREVVERMCAQPGTSDHGYLSALVQAFCDVEPLFDVSPNAFRPIPKVWSTVVRLRFQEKIEFGPGGEELFRMLLGAGFAQKRKTITNNLRGAPPALKNLIERAGGVAGVLEFAKIDPRSRAETLRLEDWQRLMKCVANVSE